MSIYENFPLTEILYYGIGPTARYLLEAANKQDILDAVAFIQEQKIPNWLIAGLGSNLLITNNFFDGAVIRITSDKSNGLKNHGEGKIESFAGQSFNELIQFSFQHDLTGLEWAGGLPSTVGGAIRGNAGAFGGQTKDGVIRVEAVEVLPDSFSVKEFSLSSCEFSYRDSFFKQHPHHIILGGTFQLHKASDAELEQAKKEYSEHIAYRKEHHPMEYPSCGSVFKNIVKAEEVAKILRIWPDIQELVDKNWHHKVSMGYITKRLGFSGHRVGGAQISEKHGNYIINKDHATAEDVLTIINQIREKFYQTFGFYPEPEVQILQ